MRKCFVITVIFIVVVSLVGCSSNPVTKQQATDSPPNLSPGINPTQLTTGTVPTGITATDISGDMVVRNEEEYLLAQWLTGDLYAPQPLSNQIAGDLKIIRREYGHSVPDTKIKFMMSHVMGELIGKIINTISNKVKDSKNKQSKTNNTKA